MGNPNRRQSLTLGVLLLLAAAACAGGTNGAVCNSNADCQGGYTCLNAACDPGEDSVCKKPCAVDSDCGGLSITGCSTFTCQFEPGCTSAGTFCEPSPSCSAAP